MNRASLFLLVIPCLIYLGCDDGSQGDGDADSDADGDYDFLETPEDLREVIDRALSETATPGLAACIVVDSAIPWCDGFGSANIAAGSQVQPHTPFLLASASKPLTATALMQLWEQGLFELDDSINDALDFDVVIPGHEGIPLTYRHLLTHTASIHDGAAMDDFYFDDMDPTISLDQVIRGYFIPGGQWYDSSDNFHNRAPGTAFDYSNMGVALVGYLVEVLAEQDFADYCDEHLFIPLGLNDTSWRLGDFSNRNLLAMPYSDWGSGLEPAGHYTFADYPNGGLRSSAYDIARFVAASAYGGIFDGTRILESATIEEMVREQVPEIESGQGLIWFSYSSSGDTWIGHDGGELGVSTNMGWRIADRRGFVILTNGDEGPITDLIPELMEFAEQH